MRTLIEIDRESGIPLIGCIAFGVIDRGANLIQVRPTSICNIHCPFCSTSANESSVHPINYIVELNYLLDYARDVVKFKSQNGVKDIIVFIDSVGEPLTYPNIVELVKGIKKLKDVKEIIMVTNGILLTKEKVDELKKAGLNQINLSINSLDAELAKKLSGCSSYDIEKIKEIARYINENLKLMITPVYIPNVNEEEIEKIILFCKELGCGIGIQKYEVYKYSRKMKEARKMNYYQFYKRLKEFENKFKIKLMYRKEELRIKKSESLPIIFKKNEKVSAEIKAVGWLKGQMIAAAKNRCISVNNCKAKVGDRVNIRITENKNNLYIGEIV